MTTAVWWIRRDLRLTDNQALHGALAAAAEVVPLFVLDRRLLQSAYASSKRTAFLLAGLHALDADLRARGSRLIVRAGDPAEELARAAGDAGATAVWAERDHSPYAVARDATVAATLPVPLHLVDGVSVRPPNALYKEDGTPYTVYTPFSKRWRALPAITRDQVLPSPRVLSLPAGIESLPLPAVPPEADALPFPAGENEAKRRLAAFVQGESAPVFSYANNRDLPGVAGTSQLSPYLRFGMLAPRLAALAAYEAIERAPTAEARRGADVWLAELIWREFYIAILHHFPHVRARSFRPAYDAIRWANDPDHFAAWCAGRTGYPIVDAAMRQLVATGWMHNRVRMIAASFLVKDLLIDWRWGERFFMQHLVDGDPAANNGGWQWTAGTGTDAAPYFRVFNPLMQAAKFDADGTFVRRWLPELAQVPTEQIHAPWLMPRSEQLKARCLIGVDYPAPIIDHAWARERVLEAYPKGDRQP